MTEVIVREIQLFIQRPGTKNNHIYYAIAYLNRVASLVAPKDEKVRMILFKIYFSLFKKIVTTKNTDKKPKVTVKKDRNKSKQEHEKEKKKLEHLAKLE